MAALSSLAEVLEYRFERLNATGLNCTQAKIGEIKATADVVGRMNRAHRRMMKMLARIK